MPFCDVIVYPRECTKKIKHLDLQNEPLKLRMTQVSLPHTNYNTKIKLISDLLILLINYVVCYDHIIRN